jgi:hypothetical protein
MKKSMKKMVLTGAAVTVMMSFAAPAMADEVQEEQRAGSSNSSASGIVDEQPLKDPGIRLCDITPTECEISTDPVDDPAQHPVNKDPDIITLDPIENPKTGNTPMDEEASASGTVKAEVIPEGIATTAPENDATSAPKAVSAPDGAGQTANSPTVHGCAYDDEYDEELDMCIPTLESFEFWSVVGGDEPWPDSAGGYVSLLGGYIEDGLLSAGFLSGLGGKITGDALVEFGKDGGPIGWGIQGVGYTAGLGGEAGSLLLNGLSEVSGIVHDGLGEAVDAIGDAAEDVWDEISSWW